MDDTLPSYTGPFGRMTDTTSIGMAVPDRYEDLGRIAAGGMGDVRRVMDKQLNRILAMKVMRWELFDDPAAQARFLEEAQITAQLQHPAIVAVHDQGRFPDGRLWFTMKEVRGRTLTEVIAELHGAARDGVWQTSPGGWTFRRLIDAFSRICQAVAYAHSSGIIHRDLKPSNLMVGEFGEVLVMDWGLAKPVRNPEPVRPLTVTTPLRDRGVVPETDWGRAMGTPSYMPPEQARGDVTAIGPASDVYALGAILFEILAGEPPHAGRAWQAVLLRPDPDLREILRVGHPPLPMELVRLAARCLAREPERRPSDAGVVASQVESWLDGAQRREQALEVVNQALERLPEVRALEERAVELRLRSDQVQEPLPPHAPLSERILGWALEDESVAVAREARLREVDIVQALHSALNLAPDLPEAREALADIYRRRAVAAEARHDQDAAAEATTLLRLYDTGRHSAWLAGLGAFALETSPPGADAVIFRYQERQRRLVPERFAVVGQTPVRPMALPMGSYLVRLMGQGCRPVDYPIWIERDTAWDTRRPGSGVSLPVHLPPMDALGPDDVYVPAGYFVSGGDPQAVDAIGRQQLWLDGFVIRRHPVTVAEYVEFLNDLAEQGRHEEMALRAPRGEAGRFAFPPAENGRFAPAECGMWSASFPVVLVDWHGAVAYAQWLAARTGRPWRLPHELEREKAARGADGRAFPWGDRNHAPWARVLNARADEPGCGRVGDPPDDVSPYGVCGLAGNVRDWCANLYHRGRTDPPGQDATDAPDTAFRSIRGGSWSAVPDHGRAGARFAARPSTRFSALGFRLAHDWPLGPVT